jgi:hypothetical protein
MRVNRIAAVTVLGLAGLLFAFVPTAATGPRAAAVDGRLSVSTFSVDDTSLAAVSVSSEDPIARLELFVPAGYALDLGKPAGTQIGFVSTLLLDAAQSSAPAFADGTIVVDDPARHASDPRSQACAPGRHAAVWRTELTVLGQTFELPIFVDPAPAGSTGVAFVLRACPGWSSAAGSGVVTGSLSLYLEQVLTPPTEPGRYTWSAFATPTLLASITPDQAHTFELRAIVVQPYTLTLRASHDPKKKTVLLTGRVTAVGEPEAGAQISFVAFTNSSSDGGSFGPVTTNAAGEFSVRRRVDRSTEFLAFVDPPVRPCTAPSSAPGGCPAESVSAPPSASAVVRVRTARDARLVAKARDQALARRITMKLSDFPSDWIAYDTLPLSCPGFDPRMSDLTVHGEVESPVFIGESAAAWSRASVYSDVRQARIAFGREARVQAVRCFAEDARSDGATVLEVRQLTFPPLGSETRAFRTVLAEGENVTTLDLVSFRDGRAVVHMGFVSAVYPFVGEAELAAKLAGRARGR